MALVVFVCSLCLAAVHCSEKVAEASIPENDFGAGRDVTIDEFVANGGNPWEYENDELPSPRKRSGNPNPHSAWPWGVIPYITDSTFNGQDLQKLQNVINYYAKHTCVRFVRRTNQKDYLKFSKPASRVCNSNIGRAGGEQPINTAQWCLDPKKPGDPAGGALHEMMHAIGFHHEQTRPDRDQYIWIYWENVDPKFKAWYDIYKDSLTYGTKYDYFSVMHYAARAGSKNNKIIMVPKDGTDPEVLANRGDSLSPTDIYRINAMYNCNQWTSFRYPMTASCADKHANCQAWSRHHPSQCENNPAYMLANCERSCQVCGPSLGCNTMPGYAFTIAYNTPNKCKRNCYVKGYKYAGVTQGDKCICGNTVGTRATSVFQRCNTKCQGDNSKYCGGRQVAEVFYA